MNENEGRERNKGGASCKRPRRYLILQAKIGIKGENPKIDAKIHSHHRPLATINLSQPERRPTSISIREALLTFAHAKEIF